MIFHKIIAMGISLCLTIATFTQSTQIQENTDDLGSNISQPEVETNENASSSSPVSEGVKINEQSKQMKIALENEEVVKLINSLRNDVSKVNEKYNNAAQMLSKTPYDTELQTKINELCTYNDKANQIINELNLLITSNIKGSTEDIVYTLLTELTNLQTQLAPVFTYASLVDLNPNIYHSVENVPEERKQIVETAMSLLGKIPYEWGGKATNGGWNKRWNKEGNGMDCSGFIEWVYWTINGHSNKDLRSTVVIADTQKKIKHEELQIGDLGMKSDSGTKYADYSGKVFYSQQKAINSNLAAGRSEYEITIIYNHVGIYVGKDMNGNDLWIHCKGDPINTVIIGTYEEFAYYYKMPN